MPSAVVNRINQASTPMEAVEGSNVEDLMNHAGRIALTGVLADVSTASSINIVCPVEGVIENISTVLGGAISGADSVITVLNGASTVGTATVAQSGSAAKDVDTVASLANTTVAAGAVLNVATDGGSTGTQTLGVTIIVRLT